MTALLAFPGVWFLILGVWIVLGTWCVAVIVVIDRIAERLAQW
jgi:hypothetical protein